MFFVRQEASRDADNEGRRCQQELFGTTHTGREEGNYREHVLARVEHRD